MNLYRVAGEVSGSARAGLFCVADLKDRGIVACAGGSFVRMEESSWVLPVAREPKRHCRWVCRTQRSLYFHSHR